MKKLIVSLLSLIGLHAGASDFSEYEKQVYTDAALSTEASLPYRILFPQNFDETQSYPLILFLHGAGERGSDNEAQLTHGAALFLDDQHRRDFPAIVVFPQAAENDYWVNVDVERSPNGNTFHFKADAQKTQSMSLLLSLVNDLKNRSYVDASKMLVMGLSMGGMGTYDIIASMPGDFQAAVAICGGAHPALAEQMDLSKPVWAFHGDEDLVVPLSASQQIVDAINAAGGKAKLTVYSGVAHNSWDDTFAEPELLPWLFAQLK